MVLPLLVPLYSMQYTYIHLHLLFSFKEISVLVETYPYIFLWAYASEFTCQNIYF
jgi:hypothetical protein